VTLSCEIKKYTESVLSDKIDFSVVENFKELSKKLKTQTSELEDLCTARDQLRKQLDTLESTRLTTFTQGFHQIANDVKEMYQMLTHEGDAELELADPLAPFTHGVTFSVRPPKKSWKHIENLSGGEKTLSSLALVFAFQKFRPTPIYFLDEIDAALDHTNVSTIALYIAVNIHICYSEIFFFLFIM
jgi:structural maintenance of chromosome 4